MSHPHQPFISDAPCSNCGTVCNQTYTGMDCPTCDEPVFTHEGDLVATREIGGGAE